MMLTQNEGGGGVVLLVCLLGGFCFVLFSGCLFVSKELEPGWGVAQLLCVCRPCLSRQADSPPPLGGGAHEFI